MKNWPLPGSVGVQCTRRSGVTAWTMYTFIYPIRKILRLFEVRKGATGRTMNWYQNIRIDPPATRDCAWSMYEVVLKWSEFTGSFFISCILLHKCKKSESSKILLWCDQYLSTQRRVLIDKSDDHVIILFRITSKSWRAKFWYHWEVSWLIVEVSLLFCSILVDGIIICLPIVAGTPSQCHGGIFKSFC